MTKLMLSRKCIIISILLAVILCAGLGVFFSKDKTTPIDSYAKLVDFQTYFPQKLPDNLSFVDGSTRISGDVIFFNLKDGKSDIVISQQSRPQTLESFRVDGFDSVATNIGSMLVGKTEDRPAAVVTTENTLITINGYAGQDIYVISSIGQSLRRVP